MENMLLQFHANKERYQNGIRLFQTNNLFVQSFDCLAYVKRNFIHFSETLGHRRNDYVLNDKILREILIFKAVRKLALSS